VKDDMDYSKDFLLSMYIKLLEIRYTEESFVEPIINNEIRCPVHLYSGEEAIAVGVIENLDNNDKVFGTHRSHGHFIAKGGSIEGLIAEVYCRSTGVSKGHGGSMHLIDPSKGFMGAAPIVGGTISLALGAALASYIREDNSVAVAFFGDGAAGEGVLYESINFAAVKKLPIIFVCENNSYSTHMHIRDIRNSDTIYETAASFNIRSEIEDGNDLLKVYELTKSAVKDCREGKGPVFLEFQTYRYRGHVGPDDNVQGTHTDIRPKEEIKAWKDRDPLLLFEKYLTEMNISNSELSEIKEKIFDKIKKIHSDAKSGQWPDSKEINNYVFK
jgi:acetoin:2,6-dichlorophenolindophenol oxidoreductase subunit alpha